MENTKVKVKGTGFCGLLTIAFIVLKLCGVINWGWIWVLAPLWISWLFVLFVITVTCIAVWIRDRWW